MQKIKRLSKLITGECDVSKKQGLKHFRNNLTRKRLNGRQYKEMLRLSAIKGRKKLRRREEQSQEGDDGNCYKEGDRKVVESPILCTEGQRVDFNLIRDECSVEPENECSQSSPVGGSKGQAQNGTHITDEHAYTKSMKSQSQSEVEKESHCAICMLDGKLLCCSGQGCEKSFHLTCVVPPLTFDPPGIWHCSWCTRKKIEFGVYSVSQGIESSFDYREVHSNDKEMRKQKEYLVKYKSLAHVHNRWIPETQLRLEAPMVFERDKWKKNKGKAEWSVPHRLVKRRLVVSPGPCNVYDEENSDCDFEWLVKWRGLNYDHCTWELANASFLKTPQAVILIKNFENRKQNSNSTSDPSTKDEEMKFTPVELSEFPFETLPGLHDSQLAYVNKLRGYWSRGQNAVVFDQDRIEKAVLFILSLQRKACKPVLIITSSNTISLWESEFSCYSSSPDIVIFNGNKEVRAIIRNLEFYDEDGSVSFQVLLATPDAIDEDLEILDHIKWEVMVIDECQRRVISMHLWQLRILAADMKLLLFSGEVLDRKINCRNVISLIDPEFEETNKYIASDPNIGTRKLKEHLAEFIAYECKFDTHVFSEYWVPVRLSSMQIEQYRDLLQSNSRFLCSSSKNDASDHLREILSSTQKVRPAAGKKHCCDHPYLVDHSLRSSVTRDLLTEDHLNAEINVSGKLQLLDTILSEVKKRGLKVLVLFQSVAGSGKISIGDILDDLAHQIFGEDYYARIEGEMSSRKRQAALDKFNNTEGKSVICLMDYRACVSSIKLSSLEIVILFNSDFNPLNDIRSLQKVTINPQIEQIKVFRLYSCFTIEEKSLILAKQGVSFDSKPQRINRYVCHMLLTWGASYICNKSNDFSTHIFSGKSFLDNVLSDLRAQLSKIGEDDIVSNSSFILKLENGDGTYPSNIKLLGEVENPSTDSVDSEEPHLFWRKVLKEIHNSKRKNLNTPSRRVHKKAQIYDALFGGIESESAKSEHQKVVNSTINKTRSKKKRKIVTDMDRSNLMGTPGLSTRKRSKHARTRKMMRQVSVQESLFQSHQNLPSHEIPSFGDQVREQPPLETSHVRNTNAGLESQNSRPLLSVAANLTKNSGTDPLERELERIQKDINETKKTYQEMQWRLNMECEEEIAAIRKKYAELIKESRTRLVKQTEILERNYKIVHDSKLLAAALAKKCETAEVAFSDAIQEEMISHFADNILQFYGPSTLTSSIMADPSVVGPTSQFVSHSFTTMAETRASSQNVNFPQCPPPLISPVEARYLPVPTINSFVNSFPGSGIRAPAPHLRNSASFSYAPLPSIPEPSLTPLTLTQAISGPTHIEMELGNVGTSSLVDFPTPDLPDGIYRLPGVDFSIQFSQQNRGTMTQVTSGPVPIEMQLRSTSSAVPPSDLSDGIYRLPPLDVDLCTLFSLENLGSNYRAI